jgi:Protein of unknown function (DUF3124)
MKLLFISCLLSLLLISCEEQKTNTPPIAENWDKRAAVLRNTDSLQSGSTYLSVYSHIYALSEKRTTDLTATISLRNTSASDTLYILKADYFDTKGKLVKSHINQPVFIAPMETAEIIIEQNDTSGGSGANFIFDWKINNTASEPLFEAIMISTSGGQGLSFTTQGKRIK